MMMDRASLTGFAVALLLFACAAPAAAQQQAQDQGLLLGNIDFPTSASGEAQEAFLTGVLALHSFWYPEARDHFWRAQQLDPGFAMAYWGEAMTHDHPLWGPLGEHDSTAARAVLAAVDSLAGQGQLDVTDRERAYVEAVRVLYNGEGGLRGRRRAYAAAMRDLAAQYPEDDEVAAFSALAQMSKPGFDLDAAEDVVPVAATLEEIYQRRPEHPGVLHYLIHVYDSPTFAELGLRPARVYAEVAPAASHALHMPSHIFRELGMWEKVAASNEEAYAASVAWQEATGRPLRMRDYHAFSWLFDAYLALERYEDARGLVVALEELVAEARRRGEDPGRIPSLAERLATQYQQATDADG